MLCNNKGFTFINNLRDDGNRWAVRCKTCGHIQVYPIPDSDEHEKYYEKNYHKNQSSKKMLHADQSNEQIMYKYESLAVAQKESVKTIIPQRSKILEIGSGYGWFVEKMKNEGFEVDGVEISIDRAQLAHKRAGITLINHNFMFDSLPEKMTGCYDAICMFHVLEHISTPIAFLANVRKCLKPNGMLIVEVPNFFDNNKKLSTAYNNFTYMYEHLSYFTPDTLAYVLKKIGFSEIAVNGMQRYSVENAIWWIRNGKPNTEYQQLELPEGLEWVNQHYKDIMENELKSYAIMAIAYKYK